MLFDDAEQVTGPHDAGIVVRVLEQPQGLLVQINRTVVLLHVVSQAALMLKDRSLQCLIAETPGGFQGLVVAGIGLLVAALLHEDLGRLPKAGDNVAVVSQCTGNVNALLCRAEGLVKASCAPQRIGEIAQRCGQVVQLVRHRLPAAVWPPASRL